MKENIVHEAYGPFNVLRDFFWKCSGADVMPNGNRLKQNLPNGVMNVVCRADSFASGICENPELASIFGLQLVVPKLVPRLVEDVVPDEHSH